MCLQCWYCSIKIKTHIMFLFIIHYFHVHCFFRHCGWVWWIARFSRGCCWCTLWLAAGGSAADPFWLSWEEATVSVVAALSLFGASPSWVTIATGSDWLFVSCTGVFSSDVVAVWSSLLLLDSSILQDLAEGWSDSRPESVESSAGKNWKRRFVASNWHHFYNNIAKLSIFYVLAVYNLPRVILLKFKKTMFLAPTVAKIIKM